MRACFSFPSSLSRTKNRRPRCQEHHPGLLHTTSWALRRGRVRAAPHTLHDARREKKEGSRPLTRAPMPRAQSRKTPALHPHGPPTFKPLHGHDEAGHDLEPARAVTRRGRGRGLGGGRRRRRAGLGRGQGSVLSARHHRGGACFWRKRGRVARWHVQGVWGVRVCVCGVPVSAHEERGVQWGQQRGNEFFCIWGVGGAFAPRQTRSTAKREKKNPRAVAPRTQAAHLRTAPRTHPHTLCRQ